MRADAGAWLAVASAVAYGALAVLAKLAFAEGWNIPSLLAVRFVLAALVILPFALRQPGSWRGFGAGLLVGGIGYAGTTALYFPSLRHLDAALSSFLLYLAPVLVAVLSFFLLREPLGRRGLAALALSLAGLGLLSGGAVTGKISALGVALAAGSAVFYAGTVVASRRLARDVPWARSALAVCVGAAASYLAFGAATVQLSIPPSTRGFVYVALIGLLATGVALSLFFAALERIGAARASVILTLEPVSTFVLAAIVLGELPDAAGIAGGLLIVGAAAMVAGQTEIAAAHE